METNLRKIYRFMCKTLHHQALSVLIFFSCFFTQLIESKVLIITHNYNRPEFTEMQVKTFKKFVKDDYEFVVFNNASDGIKRQEIRNVCKKHSLRCIEIPQEIHDRPYLFRRQDEDKNHACCRVANCIQYSLDVLGFKHDDIVVIIDTDMFLIKPFSFRDFMHGYDLAGVPQCRGPVTYFWQGLIMFNMQTLPDREQLNFNCGYVEGQACDVGGFSHKYLKNHPSVKVRFFADHTSNYWLHCEECQKQKNLTCFHNINTLRQMNMGTELLDLIVHSSYWSEYYINFTFLHYGNGTNWAKNPQDYHAKKTAELQRFIKKILRGE